MQNSKNDIGEKLNINKKFFSKIGANYLIYVILTLIFQIILVNIISLIQPEYLNDINMQTILSSIACYILPFPIIYWLMNKLEHVEIEKRSVDAKKFIIYIGITCVLMMIGNQIGLGITALLGGAIQNDIANPVHNLVNNTNIWLNLILLGIMAPIFEELIFRKLLIDRTLKYGAKVSIILSAVLFALIHGNLNQFFYTLLLGGFFAYVYIKTGKVTYTIILHTIVNIMGSVVSLIFSSSLMNIQNSYSTVDLIIVIGYTLFVLIFFIIGIYGLKDFKRARFNGIKTQIPLKYPFKTMFLNYGMILFVGYFILQITAQALS